MSLLYKFFRALIMTLLVMLVFVPASLYVALSTDWAQEKIRFLAQDELSRVLGTEVLIGSVRVTPFSRLELKDVTIQDDYDQTALEVKSIDTRFEFLNFVTTFKMCFDYAELEGVAISLYRPAPGSPLNIAKILQRLKPKKQSEEPAKFDLSVFTVRINDGAFTYNVLSEPEKDDGFDVNHISLEKLNVIATAPEISDERIDVMLRQLSFIEKRGLVLSNFSTQVTFTPSSLVIKDVNLRLPSSQFNLGNYEFDYDSPAGLGNIFRTVPIKAHILPGSYVSLSDFGWLNSELRRFNKKLDVELGTTLSSSEVLIDKLVIKDEENNLCLNLEAEASHYHHIDSLEYNIKKLELKTDSRSILDVYGYFTHSSLPKFSSLLKSLGTMSLTLYSEGRVSKAQTKLSLISKLGSIDIKADTRTDANFSDFQMKAIIGLKKLNLDVLAPKTGITDVSALVDCSLGFTKGKSPYGHLELKDGGAAYNNESLKDVSFDINLEQSGEFDCRMDVNSKYGNLFAYLLGNIDKESPQISGKVVLGNFRPFVWGLTDKYPDYRAGGVLAFDLSGKIGQWIDGYVDVTDFYFVNQNYEGLKIKKIELQANNAVRPNQITLQSDFINGSLQGNISPWTVVPEARDIISYMLPAIFMPSSDSESQDSVERIPNNFNFNFVISNTEKLASFFKIPIDIVYPVSIDGSLDYESKTLLTTIDAPYLMKGDMVVENTMAQVKIDNNVDIAEVYLTTQFPTKKGEMVIVTGIKGYDDRLSAEIDWNIEREKPVGGKIGFDVELERDLFTDKLETKVSIRPSDVRFGDDIWKFSPARIVYKPGFLSVDNFSLKSDDQSIKITGTSNQYEPEEEIRVGLENIRLLSIFETLDINKALIGGVASGVFHARGIFGPELALECPNLHVDSIGYNRCTLGDAEVKANWNNESQSFYLDAEIIGENNNRSHIYGDIFPSTESLDMFFEADRAKVGFMKPFIDAFASDITGVASGYAHLFGTFKYIDLEGDIYAEDLGLKVDFTNTWYFASDSIKLRPGLIEIPNVRIKDIYGNTANLSGIVEHTFFKDPVFDFKVTEAHNLLSYDVNQKLNPDWYGRIFGSGSAFINGRPGVVNIDVDMTTAPDSKFTFVLSDNLVAEEYGFITFRDKNRNIITDSIIQADDLPLAVREYRDRKRAEAQTHNPPSAYNMNIQVDITPEAQVVLVMDPVGGDEINCNGRGNLRMTYASSGNELRMFGNYTIERGTYNFTLQDVIVKDFTIMEGSSISFSGDPYNARLDIKAGYSVNANLSDLDESFLQDKELNRTNVPVNALLLVTGDMRQPDISFDLEFPSLTSDVYRKVKSIISTDEMMNRQIIYLLALNRFYTPEYMSATKGNELFSVASSTISSRLSSMLGKLSDHWSIAPNLRSDRGDFSDVEFDLALSSSLLNNRLRLNGNFGYRDKSLNTNQFIGDFDLEYLLNRAGSWRLKAYNRYNDQNYYLRTAQTTQGVGVMFKKDFDHFFDFIKGKDNKTNKVEKINSAATKEENPPTHSRLSNDSLITTGPAVK